MDQRDSETLIKSWNQRIKLFRKKFFFEKILFNGRKHGFHFLGKAVRDDLSYLWNALYQILKHVKHYSKPISNEYGTSTFRQIYQMVELTFKQRVCPTAYRKYHLFKPNVWKHSDDFSFSHYGLQQMVADNFYEDELTCLLNKVEFWKFCIKEGFPTPINLALIKEGEIIPLSKTPGIPQQDIFIKEYAGMMGIGAKKFTWSDSEGRFQDSSNKYFTEDNLIDFLCDYSKRKNPLLVQPVVKNHERWMRFSSGALATCRIVTAKNPDTRLIECMFATMRLPVGNSEVDNYSRGGLLGKVEVDTGEIGPLISSVPINGCFDLEKHPDTHALITGTNVPFWPDLLDLSLKLHQKFSSPFIGWDMTATTDGCMVMEGSLHWDVASYEVPHLLPVTSTSYPLYFETWIESHADEMMV